MLSSTLKKLLILSVVIIGSNYCIGQNLPDYDKVKLSIKSQRRVPLPPQVKNTNYNKIRMSDSIVIVDQNLGRKKISMKVFVDKALQKANKFAEYLKIICDKSHDSYYVNKSIKQADSLFIDDSSVEVSNIITNQTIVYDSVDDYLRNLKLSASHYNSVNLSFIKILYVPEFRMGTDGNYHSVVTFEQKFEGFIDNRRVYGDITEKNISIILKTYNKPKDGESVLSWEVYLSDIKVIQTEKI